LLQTFFSFLVVEARDVQFLDKQGKLTSFKRTQPTKNLPLFLRNEEIFVEHCPNVEMKLSKTFKSGLEENLRLRKEHIKENLEKHFERVGEILSKNVFRGPDFCEACKTRFILEVKFNNEKIPCLLQNLRNE